MKGQNENNPLCNLPDRREFLGRTSKLTGAVLFSGIGIAPLAAAAQESGSMPIPEPHFPSQMHLFVWRNWSLANLDRIADVLGTTPDRVLETGRRLGLPPKPQLTTDQLRRIYITVIRQNWHVLPEVQLIQLLGWDREHFEFTLREDDFLSHKLGPKPHCEAVRYSPETPAVEERLREVRETLTTTFGPGLSSPGEPPFQFVQDLSSRDFTDLLDTNRALHDNEIDLTGWTLELPGSSEPQNRKLLEQFQDYLQKTFRCRVATSARASGPAVRLLASPELARERDSFEITVEHAAVVVRAVDFLGLRQGISHLEKLMERRGGPFLPVGTVRKARRMTPAYLYSYFALYGDPLMEADIDPFPDGYLEKLGRLGINGVWLQAVLRNLSPSQIFPDFGQGWQTRLTTLNRLVERAKRHGINVFLYLNEPRAMPAEFFEKWPQLKGVQDTSDSRYFAMCTSTVPVRQWLEESLSHVFREVPDLGGVFSITMSENLTNCFSKGRANLCPRCSKRAGAEVVAEVLQVFRDGVRRSSQDAEVIAWDWGWGLVKNGADPFEIIRRMPTDVKLQSVSEWSKEITRGGFDSRVGEYSISVVGPGPRALNHWTAARRQHVKALAKLQVNNTWEISAVPYIPVLNLIRQHLENMTREGINGLMLSWTVGGYPSPNLEVAGEYCHWPTPEKETVLRDISVRRYGKEATDSVLKAWELFSEAFQEFPYGIAIYIIPTQHGPANPLRLEKSGHQARMILFPYDDFKRWCGPYPVEIVQQQFAVMSAKWEEGLQEFRRAENQARPQHRAQVSSELGIAETCYLHFRSVANQIRFYMLRDELDAGQGVRSEITLEMERIAEDEMNLARQLFAIARDDSRIGFEASNHYYYRPLDLAEKVLNCADVIRRLKLLR